MEGAVRYSKEEKKGIGKAEVVGRHMMIDRMPLEERRSLEVGLEGVVTLMKVVDDRMDLIVIVVLYLDVALVHYSHENRIHSQLSEMVQIHYLELHPDLVEVEIAAILGQCRSKIRNQARSLIHLR